MGIHLADQTVAFLLSCLMGALLSAAYDVFRICRVAFPTGKGVVFVQDVVYWILCAVASFLFLLSRTDGAPRVFLLAGEVVGWALYHCTVGQLVMAVAEAIINAVKAVLRFFYRFLVRPVWRLIFGIVSLFLRPVRFLGEIMKNSLRKLKFRLKIRHLILYNHYKGYHGRFFARNKSGENIGNGPKDAEEDRKT